MPRCRDAAVADEVEFATKAGAGQDHARPSTRRRRVPHPGWQLTRPTARTRSSARGWSSTGSVMWSQFLAARPFRLLPVPLAADHAAEHAPEQAWKRRSAGDGAKGPRLYDWAVASLPADEHTPPGWTRWLLIRRQITAADKRTRARLLSLLRPGGHRRRRTRSRRREPAGPSRNVSRPPRTRSVSTTTRSADTTPGIGTSLWPCWLTPTSPSPLQSPQKPWQRPHPAHPRRNPPSPGTPDPTSRPGSCLGLVALAPTPPTPRQNQPLPTTPPNLTKCSLESPAAPQVRPYPMAIG